MKLYDMTQAPNPRRVRIFLAEKGIDVPKVEVDIPSGANRAPAYLAVNPRGTVPALELDDGSVIDESIAICRYFELLQPEPNLMGRDARDAATIESWQRRIEFDGMFAVASIFRNTAPHFATRAQPGSAPDLPQIPALAERGQALLPGFFAMLDGRLANTEFIAGDRFTIADITALVTVDFARWVKARIPSEHAHTQRWYAAVSARPSARA
jgi:glutathione S-transferase